MRRNAKLSLDDLDPEVLDAARDVARRAGIPLQEWIESAVGTEASDSASAKPAASSNKPAASPRSEAPKRPRSNAPSRSSAAQRSASALRSAVQQNRSSLSHQASNKSEPTAESPVAEKSRPSGKAHVASAVAASPAAARSEPAASAIKTAQKAPEAPRPAVEHQARPAETGVTIGEMMRRLDALDRSMVESRQSSEDAATRAIEKIEDRLASVVERSVKPSGEVIERLTDIERRMGEMSTQIAAPRALGRRNRSTAAEMRDAVELVRQRQRELDTVEAMVASDGEGEPSPSVTELRLEASRLRESLGALATGRDVGALEQAMRTLASDVQRVQEPAELAAIVAPIELMRLQVDRLADEVAENVHARVSSEVDRLADKVEGAIKAQPTSFVDRDALDGIFGELEEIRRELGLVAGPERVQSLSQGLQAISAQIAQLQGRADTSDSVEELNKALIGRIDALSDKMDRVNAGPIGEAQESDLASIQTMLRTLAEKVDHVGAVGGADNLDALEKQVVALASRLDQRAADPSVAGLERMMGDLLQQVSAVRDGDAVEAAVERATRRAVAEAVATPGASDDSAFGLLRADLAEMRARQAAADERVQATMGNLNATLERLVDRLGPSGRTSSASDEGKLPGELLSSVALPEAKLDLDAPEVAREPLRRQDAPARDLSLSRLGEELLEPGMSRPLRSRPTISEASPNAGDVKANFIAAARRAALAAQTDVDDQADEVTLPKDRPARPQVRGPGVPVTSGNLIARLRGEIDRRRRPLLLGLAAVVLALGAFHTLQGSNDAADKAPPTIAANTPESPSAKVAAPAAENVAQKPVADAASETSEKAAAPGTAEKSAASGASDPTTTQAISEPGIERTGSPAATAAAPAVPKVPGMDGLKGDLAGLPSAISPLKQAALEGEGAAVFELAARLADGRGVSRDLALSAKLFEKLADTGYAPAQFKVGSFYEKGNGVIRDLAKAKLWYGRAADQGNVRSMHNLAVIHAENVGPSGKPDFATASTWFRRAAEYGVRDSQYNLAVLYARGLGLNQDLVQSYLWFSAAAGHGDEEAGRKREDVASKLSPKDLATAKSLVENFKPKTVEAAVNDTPAPKAAAMSLIGAPPPGAPIPGAPQEHAASRPSGA